MDSTSRIKNKLKPTLICCTNNTGDNRGQYFLRAERKLMQFTDLDFIQSFEVFCKFQLIFKVLFPTELVDLYNFILTTMSMAEPSFCTASLLQKFKTKE